MKIRRLACRLWVAALLAACAERPAPEPSAPASSPDNAALSAPAAPSAAQVMEPAPAVAAPALAPAPQGLDQPKSEGSAEPEFATLEAAERALNQAKSELDRLALAEPPAKLGRAASADGAHAERKDAKPGQAPSATGAATSTTPKALCENACRAFVSLSRAASAVCRLDGNGGSHCSRAKRVVADSQQRVANCACLNGD